MSQAQAPANGAVGAVVDTDDYRSIWMYLKELEFRQGFIELPVNGAVVRTRYAEAGATSTVAAGAAPEDKPHV
ncbi:MAG: 2-hydroxy-6-ketonona-2,4-dienedoic acid hydrolase, partial [Mycobacterium sp.]|nr:2-hydroxy-6-ketonona-2,4-dienedoic acid hydrolase [Mycobacterium sp.]